MEVNSGADIRVDRDVHVTLPTSPLHTSKYMYIVSELEAWARCLQQLGILKLNRSFWVLPSNSIRSHTLHYTFHIPNFVENE